MQREEAARRDAEVSAERERQEKLEAVATAERAEAVAERERWEKLEAQRREEGLLRKLQRMEEELARKD